MSFVCSFKRFHCFPLAFTLNESTEKRSFKDGCHIVTYNNATQQKSVSTVLPHAAAIFEFALNTI